MKAYLLLIPFTLLSAPTIIFAQQISQPLVDLKLPTGSGFDGYINGLYILSISLAALLAVLKIIISGVKYAVSDVVPAKANAKEDITSALMGLLLIMGAVIILELINPRLVKNNIEFQPIVIPPPAPTTPPVKAAPSPTPTPAPKPAPAGNGGPTPAPAPKPAPTTSGRCGTKDEIIVTNVGVLRQTNYAICEGTTRQELIDSCKASPNYKSHSSGGTSVTCVEKK